jgi:16S rRNA (uracil1498-N3)-methyltransferase
MNIILFDHLESHNRLASDDYRARHINRVLALAVGDQFLAGVINGATGTATITDLKREWIDFTFETRGDGSALYPVTLLVAQVRPISMRRILREAVSLGVERIILTTTDTGEKSYASAKLYTTGEYRSILIDGAMQSGMTGLSEVIFASSVEEAMQKIDVKSVRIVLDNRREGIPLSTLTLDAKQPVILAIGGERGFSDRERGIFDAHGFLFASFGPRILRTETACSSATAVLLGRMGLL